MRINLCLFIFILTTFMKASIEIENIFKIQGIFSKNESFLKNNVIP